LVMDVWLRREPVHELERGGNAQLLVELASGHTSIDSIEIVIRPARVIALLDMPRAGDIPIRRVRQFHSMPALNEQSVRAVEYENVHATVNQSLLVDDAPLFPPNEPIGVIHHCDPASHAESLQLRASARERERARESVSVSVSERARERERQGER